MSDEPENYRVEAVFNFTESGEVEVVQMFFGLKPAILITPHRDNNDFVLQVKAVDISEKHLVKTLRLVAEAIDNALKQAKVEKKAEKAARKASLKVVPDEHVEAVSSDLDS